MRHRRVGWWSFGWWRFYDWNMDEIATVFAFASHRWRTTRRFPWPRGWVYTQFDGNRWEFSRQRTD